jgi:mannose-1-phosphate guanylyltransferase/mannose-6-phosphate isomerase
MQFDIQPVIMAGGSGTRLWPLSRATYPKQFLALTCEQTLFQLATKRALSVGGVKQAIIVSNVEHRFMVQEQLREIGVKPSSIILEPSGRNTAPAVTLAAMCATVLGDDPILVVTPADQIVEDEAAFSFALSSAVKRAADGHIVVMGIHPKSPETGFGYIRAPGDEPVRPVQSFVEKPDLATASRYLDEGGYYWNGGIFIVKASVWLASLERFRRDIHDGCRFAWDSRNQEGLFVYPGRSEFMAIPSESVDYAVIEKCPDGGIPISMVPLNAGWSDLGAWDSVWQAAPKDERGNVSQGDVIFVDSVNSLVRAEHRLVGVVGLDEVIVIETPDAVMVTHLNRAQDVKKVVSTIQHQKRTEHKLHRRVSRPWGWYDSLDSGDRFQVKRILVNPGASLSLQMHHHRAEHWIVVTGTAEITNGDKVILLSENQSTYIPLGQTHRLSNPGKVPLEIIEVQSGSYLGEDDIVRFEDNYGRVSTTSVKP